MSNDKVVIAIHEDGKTTIHDAREYQITAYNDFMSSNTDEKKYSFEGSIEFTLCKFDDSCFAGNYPEFCQMKTSDGRVHTLSSNDEKLKSFFCWYNRVFNADY